MLYVCTWKNIKEIGKAPLYKQEEEKQQQKEIQMTEIITKEKQNADRRDESITEMKQE